MRRTYNFQSSTSIMDRHIPPPSGILPISKKLAHELLKRISPLHENSRLSILTENDIVFLQRTRRAHTGRLFPLIRHVETQAALSLSIEHDQVHDGNGDHVLVHFESEGIGAGRHGGIDYVAIGGGAAIGGYRGIGRGVLKGQGGSEFAVYCAGKPDSGGMSVLLERNWRKLTLPHQASEKEKRTIFGFEG